MKRLLIVLAVIIVLCGCSSGNYMFNEIETFDRFNSTFAGDGYLKINPNYFISDSSNGFALYYVPDPNIPTDQINQANNSHYCENTYINCDGYSCYMYDDDIVFAVRYDRNKNGEYEYKSFRPFQAWHLTEKEPQIYYYGSFDDMLSENGVTADQLEFVYGNVNMLE